MANPQNISFGKYIDTIIRLKAKEQKQGITEYIENLADKIGLSSRQIARIRGYEGFPEDDAVRKLSQEITELETIRSSTLSNRIILPWSVIINTQANLVTQMESGSLTIMAGWREPLALNDEQVVAAMIPALERGFKYTFLYPSPETYPISDIGAKPKTKEEVEQETQGWIEKLRDRLEGAWFNQLKMGKLSSTDTAKTDIEQLEDFKQLIQDKVNREHTFINTRLWFVLPSDYVVLYNLDPEYAYLDKLSPNLRCGVSSIKGQQLPSDIPSDENDGDRIDSAGWLYLEKDTYLEIASSYKTFSDRKRKESSIAENLKSTSGKRTLT
jgi:hypothetical protein